MLVRCSQCKTEFRLVDIDPDERVVKYFCPGCEAIVRIDLELDEVKSSSSATSYASLDRHKTVLVADDAQQVLELAQSLLQEAQYNVLLASDGAEAMRLIREEHPDLVVLDLLMPGLTGFDVLRAMRQDERVKETPVVVMSSVYKDDVLEFLQQLGAQGFLDKNQLRETLVFRTNQILSPDNPS